MVTKKRKIGLPARPKPIYELRREALEAPSDQLVDKLAMTSRMSDGTAVAEGEETLDDTSLELNSASYCWIRTPLRVSNSALALSISVVWKKVGHQYKVYTR